MIDAPETGAPHPVWIYVRIALLKAGPQDLPVSRQLLPVTVVACILLSLALGAVLPGDTDNGLFLVLFDSLLTLGWYWVVLQVARRPERFAQTSAAVFGFQMVMAPLFALISWLFLRYMNDTTWQLPVSVLMLAVALWTLTVAGRILRAATDWSMSICVALVFAQALASRSLALLLQPGGFAT